MDPEELEASDVLPSRPADGDGVYPHSSPPVVHHQFLGLVDGEREEVLLVALRL